MRTNSIDLLQFHWYDYDDNSYIPALKFLCELRDEGKIKHIGLTNFDTQRLQIITQNGIRVVSNQVSYSLIDARPEKHMLEFCLANNIKILAFGTLLGGLLSEKYLGVPEPSRSDMNTSSLRRYKGWVDKWGGWHLFQELLQSLKEISLRYSVSLSNVACRYILDKPSIGGVIIGVRCGISEHIEDTLRISSFQLDDKDVKQLETVIKKGKLLPGDCGDEYRGAF